MEWETKKVKTSCCNFVYYAVYPVIRNSQLECPRCGRMNNPIVLLEEQK